MNWREFFLIFPSAASDGSRPSWGADNYLATMALSSYPTHVIPVKASSRKGLRLRRTTPPRGITCVVSSIMHTFLTRRRLLSRNCMSSMRSRRAPTMCSTSRIHPLPRAQSCRARRRLNSWPTYTRQRVKRAWPRL